MDDKEKIGSFEWIASYEEVRYCIEDARSRLLSLSTVPSPMFEVMEIGCGTSSVSKQLVEEYPDMYITAVDYDDGIIEFMKEQTSHPLITFQLLDLTSQIDVQSMPAQQFNLIIDKGTFDAILVEGSASDLLFSLHHLLHKQRGLYLVFSIHNVDFLSRYFSIPESLFHTVRLESLQRGEKELHASVCLLSPSSLTVSFNPETFLTAEQALLQQIYQHETPLLTADERERIRGAFLCQSLSKQDDPVLPLPLAYSTLIDPALEYSYELFLEDLGKMKPARRLAEALSLSEALYFLEQMQ